MYYNPDNPFVQEGWRCPVCGRVYSPLVTMCPYCPGKITYVTYGTQPQLPQKDSTTISCKRGT